MLLSFDVEVSVYNYANTTPASPRCCLESAQSHFTENQVGKESVNSAKILITSLSDMVAYAHKHIDVYL